MVLLGLSGRVHVFSEEEVLLLRSSWWLISLRDQLVPAVSNLLEVRLINIYIAEELFILLLAIHDSD